MAPWPHIGRQPLVSMKRIARVGVLAHRLVEDRARHHVVAARLEHQAGADPVVAGDEILALLAHGGAVERRAAAGDDADRIAAGMGVDAEEGLAHGGSGAGCGRTIARLGVYWKRSMPNGLSFGSGRPAIERGDVAGGRGRERQAEMAVAEGEDDAADRAGARPMTGSESGVDGRQPIHSRAAGLGQVGHVAAHHLPHRRGAGEVGRGIGRGQLDRAADAEPVGERRGDEAVVGEEDRHRQVDRARREGGVVAALGLEADVQAEAADERRATRRRRRPRPGRSGRSPPSAVDHRRRSSALRVGARSPRCVDEGVRRRRARRRSASRMASGLVTVQYSGAKKARGERAGERRHQLPRLVGRELLARRRRGAGARPIRPWRRDSPLRRR